MMKKFFWVLCLSLYPAIATATNFDVCVDEARANHNDTAVDNYTSYKCEGSTAEKLAARPDECTGGQKPSERSLSRKTRPLDHGLFSSITWSAGKCRGQCESESSDSKDTVYTCTLRVYNDGSGPAESRPTEGRPTESRPQESRPTEGRHAESRRTESRPAGNSREQPPPAGPGIRQIADEGGRHRRNVWTRPAWSPRVRRYSGGYNVGGYGPPVRRSSYIPPGPPPPPPGPPDFWQPYPGCNCY